MTKFIKTIYNVRGYEVEVTHLANDKTEVVVNLKGYDHANPKGVLLGSATIEELLNQSGRTRYLDSGRPVPVLGWILHTLVAKGDISLPTDFKLA